MNLDELKKIWLVIKSNRWLRLLCVFTALFFVTVIVFLSLAFSYRAQAAVNYAQIAENVKKYTTLQEFIDSSQPATSAEMKGAEVFSRKSFAGFDEVIPFIAYLEALFNSVDPEGSFTVKSNEDQIFLNHYADYQIEVSHVGPKLAKLYKALDALYDSRFVTNVTGVSVEYSPSDDGLKNDFDKLELTIRLFLKQ